MLILVFGDWIRGWLSSMYRIHYPHQLVHPVHPDIGFTAILLTFNLRSQFVKNEGAPLSHQRRSKSGDQVVLRITFWSGYIRSTREAI
jgi:hypothetical protein